MIGQVLLEGMIYTAAALAIFMALASASYLVYMANHGIVANSAVGIVATAGVLSNTAKALGEYS